MERKELQMERKELQQTQQHYHYTITAFVSETGINNAILCKKKLFWINGSRRDLDS